MYYDEEEYWAVHDEGYSDGYTEGFNDALMKTATKIRFVYLLAVKDTPAAIQIKEIEESILGMWKR